jgi:hypothetical protein
MLCYISFVDPVTRVLVFFLGPFLDLKCVKCVNKIMRHSLEGHRRMRIERQFLMRIERQFLCP